MAAIQAELYEISGCPMGRLAIMPRPRGNWLMHELASLRLRGVTDVVSLLEIEEVEELELENEPEFCEQLMMRFHYFPVVDHSVPHQPGFDHLVEDLYAVLAQRGFIAIHCRAGIGRSPLLAAGLLRRCGLTVDEALHLISQARGVEVPETEEQLQFVRGLSTD